MGGFAGHAQGPTDQCFAEDWGAVVASGCAGGFVGNWEIPLPVTQPWTYYAPVVEYYIGNPNPNGESGSLSCTAVMASHEDSGEFQWTGYIAAPTVGSWQNLQLPSLYDYGPEEYLFVACNGYSFGPDAVWNVASVQY